jgi:predicted DNA-binding transcriptional regulator AlpA
MSEQGKLLVQLSADELRELIREEIQVALHNGNGSEPDRLLSVPEAAEALSKSEIWIYRNWKRLPFSVRLGRGVKFSRKGIDKWIETQKRG